MKNFILRTIVFIIYITLIYLSASIYSSNFNPILWLTETKPLAIICVFIGFIIYIIILNE